MAHITFIHGLANKPAPNRLYSLWQSALQRDNPKPDVFPSPNEGIDLDTYSISSEMVYWADVLYAAPDPDESGYGYESGDNENFFEGISRDIPLARAAATLTPDPANLPVDQRKTMENIAQQLGINQEFPDDRVASPDEFAKAWRQEYESHKEIGKQFKK